MATSQTGSGAAIPAHERHLVHVELEAPNYDTRTGTKLSQPFKQVYTPAEFKQAQTSGVLEGYNVKVLSKPGDFEVTEGVQKREAHTGPLLGQRPEAEGPAGSVATTAGETLLQTTGSLEGDHVLTADNTGKTEGGNAPKADGIGSVINPAGEGEGVKTENLSPKQKLQAKYAETVGSPAPADYTAAQLQSAIDNANAGGNTGAV